MFGLTQLEVILVVSTLLELNPLLQVYKSIRSKSAKDVSLPTFVLISCIGALWLYYGVTIANWPLIIGNVFKLLTSSAVVITYFVYRSRRAERNTAD